MMASVGDLPSLAVRRPTLIAAINLLIVIAGLAGLAAVEVRELPDVDRPVVTVRAFWDGAAPETMDAEVLSVLEGAVARVNGVTAINGASEEDNSRMRIAFAPGIDLAVAANDVREAVAGAMRQLPDGVEEVTVVKTDSDAYPIIRLAIMSDTLTQEELTRLAEDDIATELSGVPGVATVELFGEQAEWLRVLVDPIRLASFGMAVDDVVEVLRGIDLDVPAGSFESDEQQLLVRADASVRDPAKIEGLELRDGVTLKDVGQAFYSPADALSYVRLNGRRVIGLGVVRRAKSNTIAISRGVDKALERLGRRLKDVEIVKTSDDALFIKGSVREVVTTLGLSVLIVIGVLYLFLGALRPTLIPAATIPIALIGTLGAIWLIGFSINILTLLAMVLATGLIVDDAIVVLENVQRKRSQGMGSLAAAVLGAREVFFAVIATTATLVAAFLPIAFLPGAAGRLFAEFGFVLAIAVAISSFVALSLCTAIAARLPRQRPNVRPSRLAVLGTRVAGLYGRFLDFTLSARLPVLTMAICLAALAFQLLRNIDEELLPKEDRGFIQLMMQGPDGVGLDYMDRQAEQAEAIFEPLIESGEIAGILTIVGRWDLNRVFILAPLAPWEERTRTQQEIQRALRPKLAAITGATARFRGANSLGLRRAGGGIEFALTGSDYGEISAASLAFMDAIRAEIPELSDLRLSYQQTQPQIAMSVDRRRAEDLGIPVEAISNTLRAMADGLEVAELTVGDRGVPVRLQATPEAIGDPTDLSSLFVASRDGALAPLSTFVSIEEVGVAAELDRTAQKRAIEIDADMAPGYALGAAIAAVERLAGETLPPGIGLVWLGEAAALDESSNQAPIVFIVAVLIVLLVLAAQFESFTSAAAIVLTVPFGLAAAVFALYMTGNTLNIYSQIGLVMLVGLMAKNGVLVVEFADQLRDRGYSVRDAVRESATIRLRPVMMTMLSTVLSALPLAIGSGAGVEAREAIGWVVFGGLGLATAFTLVLIPVVYSLLAPLARPRARFGAQLEQELAEAAATRPGPAAALPGILPKAAE